MKPFPSCPVTAAAALAGLSPLLCLLVWPGNGANLALPQAHFLALHTMLEIASVVVSLSVGLATLWVLDDQRRQAALAVASGFLLVGWLDALHLASHAGMPDLVTPNGPHKAIVFWLLARLVAAMSLVVWCWPARARAPAPRTALGLTAGAAAAVLAASLLALLQPEAFPPLFVAGRGSTRLMLGVEAGVVVLLAIALFAQRRRLREADPVTCADERPVRDALLLLMASQGVFLLCSEQVTDIASALGHGCTVAAHACLWRGMFLNRVRRPFRELSAAHRDVAERNARYRDLVDLAPAGVVVTDAAGRIVLVNRALEAMVGHDRSALVGRPVELLLAEEHRDAMRSRRAAWLADPDGAARQPRSAVRGLRADGRLIDVEVAVGLAATTDGWRFTAFVCDVSHRRAHEQALRHRANHDPLTGLPNRACFGQRLAQAVADARARHQALALAIVDIDGFHAVNEARGSACGDALLGALARRLGGLPMPGAQAARLGSDEFALILPVARSSAVPTGATLRALLNDRDGGDPSVSIGLACWPADAAEPEALLHAAELALQTAKQRGRGAARDYDPTLGLAAARRRRMQLRLREALSVGALGLHYQPQVDLASGRLCGFEALLRWTDAELGAVSPAEFVPLAERSGLIDALGLSVLGQAMDQLLHWRALGLELPVSVNLSPYQFRHPELAERITRSLALRGLAPSLLAVEITEGTAMEDPAAAAAQLRRLADLGVEVHLDDFGTGHSSLAWLKTFPVSAIKIDRAFVAEMERDAGDAGIVRAVIALAHTLGCRVIAEGIERPGQREQLLVLGCEQGQGWLFSRALPPEQATALALRCSGVAPPSTLEPAQRRPMEASDAPPQFVQQYHPLAT
ncbi:MAG: EAL domain-containing protein [Burkholderiaceae bacterium]|nr:EAL domain-containing protein [Burkholderiaceae bacterium]